jgi:hypothetical protein
MQVVVPAVALVVATSAAHLLYLLINAVRRPLIAAFASLEALTPVLVPVRVQRLGSMLHWCGWVIRAARRGPPLTAGHVIP